MARVSKKNMKCNVVRSSTRPGKKRMVKACENGREKIIHFGAKGYGHNYSAAARKSFRARLSGGQGVDTFKVFGGRLVHFYENPDCARYRYFKKSNL